MPPRGRLPLAFAFAAAVIAAVWGPLAYRATAIEIRRQAVIMAQPAPEILKVWLVPQWTSLQGGCGTPRPSPTNQVDDETLCFDLRLDAYIFVLRVRNLRRLSDAGGPEKRPTVLVDGRPITLGFASMYDPGIFVEVTSQTNAALLRASRGRVEIVAADGTRSAPVDVDFDAARRLTQPEPPGNPRILDFAANEVLSAGTVTLSLLATGLAIPSPEERNRFVVEPIRGAAGPLSIRRSTPNFLAAQIHVDDSGTANPVEFSVGDRRAAPYRLDTKAIRAWVDERGAHLTMPSELPGWSLNIAGFVEGVFRPTPSLGNLSLTLVSLALFRVWRGRALLRCLLACSAPGLIAMICGAVAIVSGHMSNGANLGGLAGGFLVALGAVESACGLVVGLLIGLGFRWALRGATPPKRS